MRRTHCHHPLRRAGGVLVALAGLLLISRIIPSWLWLLVLGGLCVWAGWYLYYEC